MRIRWPSAPATRLPATLNSPISAIDTADTLGDRPHRAISPGRWVTRNAMCTPQVKKPRCSIQ